MHQSVSVNTQVNRKKCCYLKIIFLKRCWYSLHAYVQCMMFCILHFVPYFHSLFHYQAISLFDDCIKLLSIEHIRFRANVQNSSNFTVKVFENAPNNFNICNVYCKAFENKSKRRKIARVKTMKMPLFNIEKL